MCAGGYLLREAFRTPGVTCLYLALTRQSAKKIMWRDVLKTLNRQLDLGLTFNETALSVQLPNGSVIYLQGADATVEERQKLLGQKYVLVVVDEMASFRTDLEELIYEVLLPATADYEGTIATIGTPGGHKNLFHKITTGLTPGWSRHGWNTSENPHMREIWSKEIALLKERDPLFLETPQYKMQYLAEWYDDSSKLCYNFDAERNLIDVAPDDVHLFVIATDLGWHDATAFTVAGSRPHDATLYLLQAFKSSRMLLTDVAETLGALRERYRPSRLVVDGAAKQSVEELRQRFSLPLVATEKTDKATFIRMMDTDLRTGKIKLVRGACDGLIEEWSSLIWDERSNRPMELQTLPNDLCDSALYSWRYSRNFAAQPKERAKPNPWADPEAYEMAKIAELDAVLAAEDAEERYYGNNDMWEAG